MKLKVKNLNWLAGRPVAILNEETSKRLNVFVDDRVAISNSKSDSKKVYAVVDIFSKVVKKDEIGLSHELSSILGIKSDKLVEISSSEMSKATFLIKKKMDGKSLTKEELTFLISEIVQNNLTEAEIAYFTAAEKLNGMSKKEVMNLVEAMAQTGTEIKFKGKLIADKHCLPFDTPILIRKNGKMQFQNIGDLVEENIPNKNNQIEVLSWDDNYKINFAQIKEFFRVKSPRTLQKITLRGNRNISLTEDHSIFILRNGEVLNLPSKEIKKGDFVLVPKGFSDKIDAKQLILQFNNLLKKNKLFTKEIKFSKELMRFLGYYVSEGFKNYQGIFLNFGAHEKDLIEDSINCIKKVFGIEPTINKPHKTATRVCIYSQEFSKAFSIFECGECASNKKIPEFIFNLNKEFQLEFIKSLFDGDGHIRRGYEACYVTVSKDLASQLSYLLSFLGISCSMSIAKEYIRDFPAGKYLCSEAYYLYTQAREIYGGRERSNVSFTNLLPIKQLGEIEKEEIGWVKRRALKNQTYVTFEKLREIKEYIKSEDILKILSSDISVLEVKSNESIESSSEFVYDLKTPTERFIAGFMPICIHNCIGGIAGNRTTPILVSICVAAGLTMPKTSSRAITSASGTADVIETIANVEVDIKKLKEIVNKTGGCLIWGGSLGLAPSDDKIIRVERLLNLDIEPQMIASIMSKKISVGSKYLIIDIPYGKGAKVSSLKQAKKLGDKFKEVAKQFKINFKSVYTDGSQPIGNGYGPVLEMLDVLKVLKNSQDAPKDLKEKSLFLASELLELCKIKNPKKVAFDILSSGKAYLKFKEIINTQNNKQDFDKRVSKLKLAKFQKTIYAKKSGRIISIGNKEINSLCRVLGTPESISAGAYLHKHIGNIKKGEPILTLYSESKSKIKDALDYMKHFNPIKIK